MHAFETDSARNLLALMPFQCTKFGGCFCQSYLKGNQKAQFTKSKADKRVHLTISDMPALK